MLLLALVTAVSVCGAIVEFLNKNDGEPDQSLLLAWGVAFVVGVVSMAGQYRCGLGKVLLTARKEFISNATEAQCQVILDQAGDDVAAASQPPQSCDRSSHAGHWQPLLRIGAWETGLHRTRRWWPPESMGPIRRIYKLGRHACRHRDNFHGIAAVDLFMIAVKALGVEVVAKPEGCERTIIDLVHALARVFPDGAIVEGDGNDGLGGELATHANESLVVLL